MTHRGKGEAAEVRLAANAASGFASIVQQYLQQQLADYRRKGRRAARIRGRMALKATDYAAVVTVDFADGLITVSDGEQSPLDASIAGPYRSLIELLRGHTNPLSEHLRGRLRVRVRWSKLMLPLRVLRLVRLDRARRREPERRQAL